MSVVRESQMMKESSSAKTNGGIKNVNRAVLNG